MANITKALTRWKEVLFLVFLTRFSCFLFSFIVNDQSFSNIINYWVRWDGPHYINIAKNGYQTVGEPALFIVFYPLYPLFIKIAALITQDYNFSSILVSIIGCFIASILLYELVILDFSKRVALLSVWFLNIFPTAYFLQASYSESVFLSVSLATIFFLRKKAFVKSGIFGFLSTLSRINGLLLLQVIFLESKINLKSLITYLITPLGFLTYLLINFLLFKDPFYFQQPLLSNWYKKFEFPWVSIQNLINSFEGFKGQSYYIFTISELISIVFLFLISVFVLLKVRRSYGVYMFLNLILFTSTNFIMSTPRYSLVLFPIFIALAKIKSNFLIILVSIFSITLMFILSSFYTKGEWAF